MFLFLVLLAFGGCRSASSGGGGGSGGTGGGGAGGGDLGMSGPCGGCPSGYSCGSANGIAVCRAPSGVPLFSHVFVLVMENTTLATLQNDAATNSPYLHNTLFPTTAYATDYHGVAHPSLPNYIAMTSGTQGTESDGSKLACDCPPQGMTCTGCGPLSISPSCGCEQAAMHIGDQLDDPAAHLSWKAYAESMGSACNLTATTDFVPRHVPFLYFKNVQEDSARCTSHVVDYTNLTADLKGTVASYVFIAPNLTDDMHGTSIFTSQTTNINNGDKWLMANVPTITDSAAYKQGGVLFIVWDEDDSSGGIGGTTDDPVPMFVLSPLAKTKYVSPTKADHYALLATIEDGLGLPRLGGATSATPLVDFFPAQ